MMLHTMIYDYYYSYFCDIDRDVVKIKTCFISMGHGAGNLCCIASEFLYWKDSMEFHLRIVYCFDKKKTKMHFCRYENAI